jgi:hypothetical protein
MREIVVRTDVTDDAGLGEFLETVATVCLPDKTDVLPELVCFARPGGTRRAGGSSWRSTA